MTGALVLCYNEVTFSCMVWFVCASLPEGAGCHVCIVAWVAIAFSIIIVCTHQKMLRVLSEDAWVATQCTKLVRGHHKNAPGTLTPQNSSGNRRIYLLRKTAAGLPANSRSSSLTSIHVIRFNLRTYLCRV